MWNNQKQQKLFYLMSNLQIYYHFKLDFQKMDQHTGGKWLMVARFLFLKKYFEFDLNMDCAAHFNDFCSLT